MKSILIIIIIFFSNFIFATEQNSSEVEIINLYESKSLDQMVLDNLNEEDDIDTIEETEDASNENIVSVVEEKQIETNNDNFIFNNKINDLGNYFDNLERINSKIIQKEINKVFESFQFNLDAKKDKEIFFLIVNYFKSIGQINKSYELIEAYELTEDKYFNYYTQIKLNYFLSTFQLTEACSLNEELNLNIKLDYFFLEKLDIFCLILNDNQSEANLLNSILIETEKNVDNYYQNLLSLLSNSSNELEGDIEINSSEINKELIFLYSAMTRIAELPFLNEFYELDKKNLSIPIILNQASSIDLRIKAANESFLEKSITIDSLSALYMAADFSSGQLNNPEETLQDFENNKELSMAFLFQLVNIQIFPEDRLNILIQFWDFAKKNNLEEIAYKLSINMLSSIEVSSENIKYGPQIAKAYIFNNNFESAVNWIELYENAKEIDSKSIYARILLDLYSSNDLNSFIDSINTTLISFTNDKDNQNAELLYVLKSVMSLSIYSNSNINLENIFDDRPMPSIFLFNEINNSILNNDEEKFLIYSSISLNNKLWNDIHPEHLKLILNGYLKYKNGLIFRDIILEIFKNYKFII